MGSEIFFPGGARLYRSGPGRGKGSRNPALRGRWQRGAMPKRCCPFGDASPLQLKVRVGPKELSRGVFGERYTREIFEKTKQLLFRGAQAYMDHMWDESCAMDHLPEPAKHSHEAPRAMCTLSGQMLIGQDGKLLRRCAQATDDTGAQLPEEVEESKWRPNNGVSLNMTKGFQYFYVAKSVNHRHLISPTDSSEAMSKACSSCVRTVHGKETCSQCDRFLCQSCIKICYGCNAVVCSLCAVVNSSDIGESALCSGCSMFET